MSIDVGLVVVCTRVAFVCVEQGQKQKACGSITAQQAYIEHQFTMIDYIRGGCEISLFVAIDVSADSNEL